MHRIDHARLRPLGALSRLRQRGRPALVAAATLAGAALLAGPTPSLAQQSLPTVSHSAPGSAVKGTATAVSVAFSLPPGFQLVGHPRIRVTEVNGKLLELLPTSITQRPPAGKGSRALHTGAYKPGIYQVSAEVVYLDRAGKRGVVASPISPLVVLKR